ncbi:hypothetical protein AGDE_08554 [Angomonas deanei]|uniref:Uncharacterized protein n=1 Tax=Angomonas deanei TaxID=59799 RepID=A0A7G2C8I6_9TRYP|nr:hypothetical protein AGDE_08554 [Angomonas deanei]CAD2215127.1 hypothetical protein, conserved [Angomonas deanei]|eukprot:EPY32579.1 hypothetical protein AGDE_08554 [Angomonas deanei]
MIRRCFSLLASATGSDADRTLRSISGRLSPKGASPSLLQALVEDEFPLFHPSQVGASTMKEVVQQHPELFRVKPLADGGWAVFSALETSPPVAEDRTPQLQRDYQKVLKYCEEAAEVKKGVFIPLESILYQCGIENKEIADYLMETEREGLEVKLSLNVKSRRHLRAAILLVDGDDLPINAVTGMMNQLNINAATSDLYIFRQSYSNPLTRQDVVAPANVPTAYLIEKKARELRLTTPDLLKDVVYLCSSRKLRTYSERVGPQNVFPDADVYVCSPSQIRVIHEKKLVPI